MRIIRATDCRVMPWKNGGGTTTEIAVFPAGASLSEFDWRISIAHVMQDGPFSCFPGIDRTLSIMSGNGIRLNFGASGTATLLQESAPFTFAADRAVDGALVDGPIKDLNVMSRRGVHEHQVQRLLGGIHHHSVAKDACSVLVVRSGAWLATSSGKQDILSTFDGLVLSEFETTEIQSLQDGDLYVTAILRT